MHCPQKQQQEKRHRLWSETSSSGSHATMPEIPGSSSVLGPVTNSTSASGATLPSATAAAAAVDADHARGAAAGVPMASDPVLGSSASRSFMPEIPGSSSMPGPAINSTSVAEATLPPATDAAATVNAGHAGRAAAGAPRVTDTGPSSSASYSNMPEIPGSSSVPGPTIDSTSALRETTPSATAAAAAVDAGHAGGAAAAAPATDPGASSRASHPMMPEIPGRSSAGADRGSGDASSSQGTLDLPVVRSATQAQKKAQAEAHAKMVADIKMKWHEGLEQAQKVRGSPSACRCHLTANSATLSQLPPGTGSTVLHVHILCSSFLTGGAIQVTHSRDSKCDLHVSFKHACHLILLHKIVPVSLASLVGAAICL